jgi:hypothetical protein
MSSRPRKVPGIYSPTKESGRLLNIQTGDDHRPEIAAVSRSWWGSRSSLMVLVSIILIFCALPIIYFALEHPMLHFLGPIGDAMLVVSVTVLLTELGPFRSYIEERLHSLKMELDRPIFERLTDPCYLRNTFKPELVHALQRASTCASLPPNIKDYPEFLSVIDKYVIPLAAEPVWRKNFNLSVIHTVENRNGQTLILEKSTVSCTYVNTSDDEKQIKIPIVQEGTKFSGVPDEDLCREGWAIIKPEGSEPTRMSLSFHKTDLGDSIKFEDSISLRVGKQSVLVTTGYVAMRAPNDTIRLVFSVPTTGLSITYQHPPEISPELYCFNVGGELDVVVKEQTLHQWKHTGTFLPDHGAVLTHPVMRRKAEKITLKSEKLAVSA